MSEEPPPGMPDACTMHATAGLAFMETMGNSHLEVTRILPCTWSPLSIPSMVAENVDIQQ